MRYLNNNLYKSHSLNIIIALFIIVISSNCVFIENRLKTTSPSPIQIEYSYYPNGQQEYAARYLNDKLDGLSQHWSEDGILISASEYSFGKPHGIWKKYYPNQNIMLETPYFHGQKHGMERWYYDNGQIKSEQSFHYGIATGTIIRWKLDGSIIY